MENDKAAKPKRKTAKKKAGVKKAAKKPGKKTAKKKEMKVMSDTETVHIDDMVETICAEEIPEVAPTAGYWDRLKDFESGPKDIPVEDLANGVTNALGEGLGLIIESGSSVGSIIASDARSGARVAMSGATAGYEKFRDLISGLKGNEPPDELDEGFLDKEGN